MAEANADVPCCFRWDILNLLIPQRQLEATFYIESPTLTQWQVNFEPQARQNDSWPFSFSLCNVRFGERDDVIVVDEVRVRIAVDENILENRLERYYSFSTANQYTYQLPGNVPATEVWYDVTIEVQISFPNTNIVNPINERVPREVDALQLVRDLTALAVSHRYFNLRLRSRVPNSMECPVHSYIIRARWNNFFSVHPVHTITNNIVELNISNALLNAIPLHVYTTLINSHGILGNPQSMTELFQVIDRYKMAHLYKIFVVDDSRQLRRTKKDKKIYFESFRMDRPPWGRDRSFSWTFNQDGDYGLDFRIQFAFSRRVPSFSYTLHSRFPYRIFIHVHLELESKHEGRGFTFHTVHGRDHTIDANETITSVGCRFVGNPSTIDEFLNGIHRRGRSKRRIEHFIRCTLLTSDGTEVIRIQSEGNGAMLGLRERRYILSDHMYEMLMSAMETDWQISCPLEWPEDPNVPNMLFDIHRSIFTARVPGWRAVLENAQEWIDIPAVATCNLSSEAFRIVVAYIYSGKLFPISHLYLEEIRDFAERGGLRHLRDFLGHRRSPDRGL